MNCQFGLVLMATVCLASCKNTATTQKVETDASATGTVTPPRNNPLVAAAQVLLNQTNQGRACTSFQERRLETTIDSDGPEYLKRQVLIKHGVSTFKLIKTGQLTWAEYAEPKLNEADGKGVFIRDGSVLFYCFGHWQVTAAEPTDTFAVAAGQRAVIGTVVLKGAPAWVMNDPAASALAQASFQGDPAILGQLNQYGKLEPVSYKRPNRVPFALEAK
jgi:hypothetical protein